MYRARQRHVSAIAGAIYGDATRVEVGLRFDPVEQRAYVPDRVFAPDPVIEASVSLAVAAGTADVGLDHRRTERCDPHLVNGREYRSRLALRPPVNSDDDRVWTFALWLVNPCRHAPAVESRITHKLGR